MKQGKSLVYPDKEKWLSYPTKIMTTTGKHLLQRVKTFVERMMTLNQN